MQAFLIMGRIADEVNLSDVLREITRTCVSHVCWRVTDEATAECAMRVEVPSAFKDAAELGDCYFLPVVVAGRDPADDGYNVQLLFEGDPSVSADHVQAMRRGVENGKGDRHATAASVQLAIELQGGWDTASIGGHFQVGEPYFPGKSRQVFVANAGSLTSKEDHKITLAKLTEIQKLLSELPLPMRAAVAKHALSAVGLGGSASSAVLPYLDELTDQDPNL